MLVMMYISFDDEIRRSTVDHYEGRFHAYISKRILEHCVFKEVRTLKGPMQPMWGF